MQKTGCQWHRNSPKDMEEGDKNQTSKIEIQKRNFTREMDK